MAKDSLPPCVADTLFSTRQLTVAGKQVGITGLDAAFAVIQTRGLTGNAAISAELIRRIRENNYIPPALVDEYAVAVLAEYHRAMTK
ncbi:MAG: hypothetical protein ABSG28_00670 [Methanoregula sp.]|jgi:hypothetical protein|uniref:hypothetical protein n=1 Tax=Methanoregula sp. TaxID=2052170 RepID=UPI003C13D76B